MRDDEEIKPPALKWKERIILMENLVVSTENSFVSFNGVSSLSVRVTQMLLSD